MINRIFGTLCALAIVGVVVFAVLNYGNYRSLCFNATPAETEVIVEADTLLEGVAPAAEHEVEVVEAEVEVIEPDSVTVQSMP